MRKETIQLFLISLILLLSISRFTHFITHNLHYYLIYSLLSLLLLALFYLLLDIHFITAHKKNITLNKKLTLAEYEKQKKE